MLRLLLVLALLLPAAAHAQKLAKATFAAGCFWSTEEAFDKVPGVVETVSGYMGGKVKNPTYEQVSAGVTGHTEVLQVTYDPSKVSYEELLEVFWINHDPTMTNRQFCDSGSQYRPGIFTHDDEQKRLAEASKAKWEKDKPFKQKILTPIEPATEFWNDQAGTWHRVTATRLNVREGPGANSKTVGYLQKEDVVVSVGISADGNWVQIRRFDGLTGWCSISYLDDLGSAIPATVVQKLLSGVTYYREERPAPRKKVSHALVIDLQANNRLPFPGHPS